jgi:hypothetical protein
MLKMLWLMFSVCLVGIAFPSNIVFAGDQKREVPYTGTKVTSSTLLCKASNMAAGGFWNKNGGTEEGARIQAEPQPTFWKVIMSSETGTAEVIRSNANNEELTSPVAFNIEITPTGGILLVSAKRARGTSPETITIDANNSSFVYSSQHVNSMWNRANIWYGTCRSE